MNHSPFVQIFGIDDGFYDRCLIKDYAEPMKPIGINEIGKSRIYPGAVLLLMEIPTMKPRD